jgi:zinc protease
VHLRPLFGEKGLSEITPGLVQDYRIHRNKTSRTGKPPSRSTIHTEIVALRQVLKTANRHGWIEALPDLSAPYKTSGKVAHRAWFSPETLVAVVVGDVDALRAVDEAERVFGDWTAAAVVAREALAPVARPSDRRRAVFPMMNKAQADIAYGFTTIARRDPSYHAFSVLNNVLGQYAMGGRLGDRIREREGMAYYVFTAFEPNVAEGPLVVRAGVNPANVDRAIAAIDDELRVVRFEGVAAPELAESKQYLVGSMPRVLETNAGIASFLQACEQFGLGLDYDRRLPGHIDAVTLDEVNELARRYLDPEVATVTVAGPYRDDGHPER